VVAALEAWAAREAPRHLGLLRLGYFGSYARGDWGVGSDVDLIAIIEGAAGPFERRALDWELLDLPVPAEILVYTREEWERLRSEGGRFVRTIEREVAGFSAAGQRATTESSAALQKTLASVQSLSESLDREAASTLAQVRGTLQKANTAVEGANLLLDPRGRTVMQVQDAADDLAATAARLRDLSERVDRDPTILIRGRRR